MSYESYKRDLAIRINRKLKGCDMTKNISDRIDMVMDVLDEFLPKDDSAARGHTHMVDLACVYEVDECPNCGKKEVQYSDAYEFCNECGYTFN